MRLPLPIVNIGTNHSLALNSFIPDAVAGEGEGVGEGVHEGVGAGWIETLTEQNAMSL